MKKVKFHTLGCKVNLYETEAMKGLFEKAGYEITESEDADVFVINTCTVTAMSDRKSRQMIRRAKKKNPKEIDNISSKISIHSFFRTQSVL